MKWRFGWWGKGKETSLEEQRTHTTHFTLLFHKYLEVLVDDRDSQQNTSSRSNGT